MITKFLNRNIILSICVSIGLTFSMVGTAAPVNFVPEVHSQLDYNHKAYAEWTKGANNDIQALGIGLAPEGSDYARGRILARRAAVVDAQRNLLEYINGVSLNADTNVSKLAVDSDEIRSQVSGIVRNATIVYERYNSDRSYEVILSVPMYGENRSLASVVVPKMIADLSQEVVPAKELESNVGEITEHYTGIVVNAIGFGLDTTFAPAIYDTKGRIVYGLQKVDHSFIINHGMVEYAKSIEGKNRAGSNPLVVKAINVRGGKNSVNKVNVVISEEDANKILLADKKYDFMKKCSVVFVR